MFSSISRWVGAFLGMFGRVSAQPEPIPMYIAPKRIRPSRYPRKDRNSKDWRRPSSGRNPATKPKRRKSQRKVAQARARKAARRAS